MPDCVDVSLWIWIFNISTRKNAKRLERKREFTNGKSHRRQFTYACRYKTLHFAQTVNRTSNFYVSIESFTPTFDADKRRPCNVIVFWTCLSSRRNCSCCLHFCSSSVLPSVELVWWSNERRTYGEYILFRTEAPSTIYADFINFNETHARKGVFVCNSKLYVGAKCKRIVRYHLFVVRIIGSISIQKGFR